MPQSSIPPSGLDLSQLFSSVASVLADNQGRLNQMDGFNGDHGDNMVQIFKVAAEAFTKRQDKPPDKALSYAAKQVKKLSSGSAQVYAEGFKSAAKEFKGRETIDVSDLLPLLNALLSVSGVNQATSPSTQPASTVESLLGALTGSSTSQGTGVDDDSLVDNLLRGGLAFLQASDSDEDVLSAGLQALIGASPLSEVPHRQESASLIVSGLLNALPGLLGQ
jgi:hypothetical protein